ncbi:uncharacterized protein BYT42DRAFT_28544 [Radiomyces spectabilis]|uniref:uncharacterized protein n=1 Tax=Radiomyces spectabilis TaxID=64574 RepID=UPI0022203183|nr:uncharacterized protein BYT42DRAFT_28544 [Radiomyces spectabilis]KAI8394044.1 hypothetical protein BYT42DRAFT_28544 [Radiomyces spectabilis]
MIDDSGAEIDMATLSTKKILVHGTTYPMATTIFGKSRWRRATLENLPLAENRWFVQGHDVSTKFHDYRQACILASRTTEFAIETHFNELLAMSGVLSLQRRGGYEDLPAPC